MENISTQSKNRQSEGPCLRFACLSAVAYNLGSARWTRRSRFPRRQCLRGTPAGQPALSPASLWASVTPFLKTPFWRTRHASMLLARPARHAFCGGFLKSASGTGGVHPAAPLQPGWAIKSPAFSSFPIINGMTSSRRICSTLENSPYSISSASFMIFSSAAWNFFPSLSFSSRLK